MEWISVKERLPEVENGESHYVLCVKGIYLPFVARYDYEEKQWVSPDCEICLPTHWQPLPEPPKE